jgi:hypothetical protein
MNSIETKSADYARRILALKAESKFLEAYDLMSEWSVWRDTLTGSEKVDCVNALVALENTLSEGALGLLRVHDPAAYETYINVRGLGA